MDSLCLPIQETQDFQYINLTVTIDEQDQDGYDIVDIMHIPVAMYSFSKSAKYNGILGIATVTLGYSFVSIIDQSSNDDMEQGQQSV